MPASLDDAKTAWTNLNIYLARLAKSPEAQMIPVLAGQARLGLRTMALALEHSSGTRLERNIERHVPAAVQWLRIAEGAIEGLCRAGTERFTTGDLWDGRGGGEICDGARLHFWRARIVELGY